RPLHRERTRRGTRRAHLGRKRSEPDDHVLLHHSAGRPAGAAVPADAGTRRVAAATCAITPMSTDHSASAALATHIFPPALVPVLRERCASKTDCLIGISDAVLG